MNMMQDLWLDRDDLSKVETIEVNDVILELQWIPYIA